MEKIADKLNNLKALTTGTGQIYKPEFYRINTNAEKQIFLRLLETPGISVSDFILDQLKELTKYKNPSVKFAGDELEAAARRHISAVPMDEYGVWVYYPWSNRLVHILDEEEFVDLRTSRNQYKITKEERAILSKKRIGVIGLSVGQSVSLTLAMERTFGELRLADFDLLELTNLNRIRTGVHNLGTPKVYAVAREIAEIDPYLNVKCFPDGVTENNIDAFFTGDGKLDLLIEESDGFDIKILSRYKARELGIPVIMEASDRCMVDVERFDLEPERDILHGIVKHLDLKTLKSLKTNEEKIPYMLDILGLETCSVRLRASMIEIEQTINTWPQLASAVVMGGGITADVSRRIMLNQYTESGRYHVDIEDLIGNKRVAIKEKVVETEFPELTEKLMVKITSALKHQEGDNVAAELITKWVEDAIKAPSAGNNQPWKWFLNENDLYLFHDKQKSAGWSDPFDHLAQIGLGTSLQNFVLSAEQSGYKTTVDYFPLKNEPLLIARFSFKKNTENISTANNQLYNAIDIRCTNRKKGSRQPLEKNILEKISSSVTEGCDIIFAEKENDINELAEIISTVEKLRFLHPEGHREFFKKEIRWNENEVHQTKDGIDIATLEISFTDQTGLRVASNPEVIAKVREWKGGAGLQKITRDAVKSSSAVGLLRLPGSGTDAFVRGGQEVQRAWLAANSQNISFHPVASPLFFFERIKNLNDLPDDMIGILRLQQKRFSLIFPEAADKTNIFLFRLSQSQSPSKRSLRRDIEKSFVIKHLENVHI